MYAIFSHFIIVSFDDFPHCLICGCGCVCCGCCCCSVGIGASVAVVGIIVLRLLSYSNRKDERVSIVSEKMAVDVDDDLTSMGSGSSFLSDSTRGRTPPTHSLVMKTPISQFLDGSVSSDLPSIHSEHAPHF